MAANNPQPTAANTWTEPPWSGWIETTGDALLILEAARRGLIPRVTRRLVDSERKMITSGSVFVFDEDESGIKRWTDGFFWSPSRILGNFLLYRETDKRGAGHRGPRSDAPSASDTNEQYNPEGIKIEGQSLSRPKGENSEIGIDKHRERTLMGSLTNSYKFKPEGLMKKTFSLTIGGVSQHLISYYKVEDVENGRLRCPSALPELASLEISPEYLDKTHFRNPPKVEIGVDGLPRYRGEADIEDGGSPTMLSAPLSSGVPLLKSVNDVSGSGLGKRGSKRYDPYGASGSKRPRKNKSNEQNQTSSPSELSPISPPQPPAQSQRQSQPTGSPDQQSPTYSSSDTNAVPGTTQSQYAPYTVPYYQMPHAYPPHPQMYNSPSYAQPPPTGSSSSVSPTSPTPHPAQPSSSAPSVTIQPQYSAYTYTPPPPHPPTTNPVESQQVTQQQYQYQYVPSHSYPAYSSWSYPSYQHQQGANQPVQTSSPDLGDKSTSQDPEGVENGQT